MDTQAFNEFTIVIDLILIVAVLLIISRIDTVLINIILAPIPHSRRFPKNVLSFKYRKPSPSPSLPLSFSLSISVSSSSRSPSLDIYVSPVFHLVPAVPPRGNAPIMFKDISKGVGGFSPSSPPAPLRTSLTWSRINSHAFFYWFHWKINTRLIYRRIPRLM